MPAELTRGHADINFKVLISIPNQEDHGFYPWVNWSSGTGCSPLVGVSWVARALPVGLHALIFLFHFKLVSVSASPLMSSAGIVYRKLLKLILT